MFSTYLSNVSTISLTARLLLRFDRILFLDFNQTEFQIKAFLLKPFPTSKVCQLSGNCEQCSAGRYGHGERLTAQLTALYISVWNNAVHLRVKTLSTMFNSFVLVTFTLLTFGRRKSRVNYRITRMIVSNTTNNRRARRLFFGCLERPNNFFFVIG